MSHHASAPNVKQANVVEKNIEKEIIASLKPKILYLHMANNPPKRKLKVKQDNNIDFTDNTLRQSSNLVTEYQTARRKKNMKGDTMNKSIAALSGAPSMRPAASTEGSLKNVHRIPMPGIIIVATAEAADATRKLGLSVIISFSISIQTIMQFLYIMQIPGKYKLGFTGSNL